MVTRLYAIKRFGYGRFGGLLG